MATSIAQQFVTAVQARLYLNSALEPDEAERLFATPLDEPTQVQRLADKAAQVLLLLRDAHKSLPVLE